MDNAFAPYESPSIMMKLTVRVIPIEGEAATGACVHCGKPSPREVYFAQAY